MKEKLWLQSGSVDNTNTRWGFATVEHSEVWLEVLTALQPRRQPSSFWSLKTRFCGQESFLAVTFCQPLVHLTSLPFQTTILPSNCTRLLFCFLHFLSVSVSFPVPSTSWPSYKAMKFSLHFNLMSSVLRCQIYIKEKELFPLKV
jgi:hypothetical protein